MISMNRKSQFTIFVIIGIVFVFIFGFVFVITKKDTEVTLEKQADKIMADLVKKGIDEYMSSCLNKVTAYGIMVQGIQGGNLYVSQGGTIPDPLSIEYYPFLLDNTPWKVKYGIEQKDSNPFGKLVLNPLCDKNGPNAVYLEDQAQTGHSCEPQLYNIFTDAKFTVQGQLTHYIMDNLGKCANITSYAEGAGHDVVLAEAPNISVVLGPRNVVVNMHYPMEIRIKGGEPVKKRRMFSTVIPVRLQRVYTYAYLLLEKDTNKAPFNNPFFDLTKTVDYTSISYFDNSIRVELLKNPFDDGLCPSCINDTNIDQTADNVLVVTDLASQLQDTVYKLIIPIKNRRPWLDNVTQYLNTGILYDNVNKWWIVDALSPGYIELAINQLGNKRYVDPDDNSIELFMKGWRADYWTDFALRTTDALRRNPNLLPPTISEVIDSTIIASDSELAWRIGTNGPYYTFRPGSDPATPTDDPQYTDFDMGAHRFTVALVDEAGLNTSQDVIIFVPY